MFRLLWSSWGNFLILLFDIFLWFFFFSFCLMTKWNHLKVLDLKYWVQYALDLSFCELFSHISYIQLHLNWFATYSFHQYFVLWCEITSTASPFLVLPFEGKCLVFIRKLYICSACHTLKKVADHHTTTLLKENSTILEITLMEQEYIKVITLWESHYWN